jgi:peptidoglycan/LPS O-acetylase OafA/YrhL
MDQSRHSRNAALDGIRGVAIVLVLITHGHWAFPDYSDDHAVISAMVFGWCGVDLFFVLSGFLITGILLKTRTATNRARSFYARRFLRIFAIYYIALSLLLLMAAHSWWLSSVMPVHTTWQRFAFYGYLQNWLGFRNPHYEGGIVGHFWSLAVEEQFYLIWPAIVWWVPERFLMRLCLAGIACAFALRIVLVGHYGPHLWIHQLTPTRGEGLLVGAALAVFARRRKHLPGRLLGAMAIAGAALIVFIGFADPREFYDTDAGPYMYTIGVTALGLLFGGLVGSSQMRVPVLTRLMEMRWLRSFGKYSYGIYIYHIPLLMGSSRILEQYFHHPFPFRLRWAVVYFVCCVAASYAVARLSYWLIEERLLRLKDRFEPIFPKSPEPVAETATV